MAVTLKDVARRAGVSIKTVSNVIHDYPHIRVTTRERVERAIAELGYTPNQTARNLRLGRTGVLALAVPDLALSYFAELAGSVIEAAEELGFAVQVEQTGGTREREIDLLRTPRLRMTDGVLFSPLQMGQDDAAFLDVDYPLVLLGERIFDGPTDHARCTTRRPRERQSSCSSTVDGGGSRSSVRTRARSSDPRDCDSPATARPSTRAASRSTSRSWRLLASGTAWTACGRRAN